MILLAAAARWETRPLAAALALSPAGNPGQGPRWRGARAGRDLLLVETGIGGENARKTLEGLGLSGGTPFSAVLSVGLSGALQPGMAPGDLVLEARGAPQDWLEPARARAKDLGLRLHMGAMLCAEGVVCDPSRKRLLGESRRAAAVDMESGAVRSWARAASAPFAAARVILDGVDERMPEAAPESGSARALAGFVLARPLDIPLLLRLGLRQRSAMRSLALFLKGWLDDPAFHETETAA